MVQSFDETKNKHYPELSGPNIAMYSVSIAFKLTVADGTGAPILSAIINNDGGYRTDARGKVSNTFRGFGSLVIAIVRPSTCSSL